MSRTIRFTAVPAIAMLTACGGSMPSSAGLVAADSSSSRTSASAKPSNRYVRTILVSDDTSLIPAAFEDKHLVNGWGLAATATSFWWVANNGTGTSSLYDGTGKANPALPFIDVPGAGDAQGTPTGIVSYAGSNFKVTTPTGAATARFLFAAEDGTISGWAPGNKKSFKAIDNSASGAVYKGLAYASTAGGDRLYAANFHDGRVEVWDGSFAPVTTAGAFTDPALMQGFAPFGIQAAGATVFVSYAKRDAAGHDEVAGKGLGAVSAFDTEGHFLRRAAAGGRLNAPWGMAVAPADFGRHSGELLVGNFGDGRVVAFPIAGEPTDDKGARDGRDGAHGEKHGQSKGRLLRSAEGPIQIDGLWGIAFGNGANAGPTNALFFAAGPGDEAHGAFGRIDVAPPGAHDDGADAEHEDDQDED
jgi:uncharacterized protein (TIGR03118 family)